MTAAALPLLTAGNAAVHNGRGQRATQNNGQNGTTLNASVSAGLTQDKTYAWDLTKTAEPASLDIWKGDAGKVHHTGLSQSGSFAYDCQVTGDHTDTAQVLTADQDPALAQASATVKVNVWSLDIAKPSPALAGGFPVRHSAGPGQQYPQVDHVFSRPADIAEFLFDPGVYTNRDVSCANVK